MDIFGDVRKTEEYGTAHSGETDVEGVVAIGYDPAINKWLALEWAKHKTIWLVGGGREEGESYAQTAVRELREETGYDSFVQQIQLGGPVISHYYNDKKALYRRSYSFAFLFILDSTTAGRQALEAHEQFEVVWLDYDKLRAALEETGGGVEHWLAVLAKAREYTVSKNEILVDEQDKPVGSKHWRTMQYDDIYRVSALWLTDSTSGDVLLAQRKWTKKNDPGKWGAAVSGTVEVGEDYKSNIVKEIQEEIGLTGLTLSIGPKLFNDDGKHRSFCQWFFGSVDKNKVRITIQEDEVEAVKWVSKKWLLNDVKLNPQNYTPLTPKELTALGVTD
jgi:8-oxo-dGTP pyrophosphatase MutT (NUDIX family)